eukprot:NODE_2275_length_1243_cov_26.943049_g2072_i0.p1 GENE.NODE_2275_length_1243_cov_26.943049_g2072_i0~~NODE_2275_length_1243_cov_26.943049_g2072_i0.p1  ORF type:complete len:376 (+),score=87.66 NODE_2275_length_1243_cov_26.943049_g2072_i0:60-1130(+)
MIPIFNRSVKRVQRDRAALSNVLSCVHNHFAAECVQRLSFFKRQFGSVLDLGCHQGHVLRHMRREGLLEHVHDYVMCDSSAEMLRFTEREDISQCMPQGPEVYMSSADAVEMDGAAPEISLTQQVALSAEVPPLPADFKLQRVRCDEEQLPFSDEQFDLIITNLNLHWLNDLEGTFEALRRKLKPDGVLLGCVAGEGTLAELNACFSEVEQELDGGVSPHTSPFVGGSDIAALLLNTGFKLPTVDVLRCSLRVPSAMDLMRGLQQCGESNALQSRRMHTPRATIMAAAELYDQAFAHPSGGVVASLDVVNFVGWSPHESQPQPKKRGSGQVSLKSLATDLGEMPVLDHGCGSTPPF